MHGPELSAFVLEHLLPHGHTELKRDPTLPTARGAMQWIVLA